MNLNCPPFGTRYRAGEGSECLWSRCWRSVATILEEEKIQNKLLGGPQNSVDINVLKRRRPERLFERVACQITAAKNGRSDITYIAQCSAQLLKYGTRAISQWLIAASWPCLLLL